MKMQSAFLRNIFSGMVRKGQADIGKIRISGLKQPETVFFIVGHPKSGTTWLSKILDRHPEVCCNYEGHFFSRNDGFITLSNSLRSSDMLRKWAERPYNRWSLDIDKEIGIFVKMIVQYYIQTMAEQTGKRIIGDKSPTYQLGEMAALFPDARVIHIIRDGRDVAVSMAFHKSAETDRYMSASMAAELDARMREVGTSEPLRGLPDDFVAHAAAIWDREVGQCMNEGREKFGENYLEVRYEGLIASPVSLVEDIFTFIGARSTSRMVKACLKDAEFSKLSGGRKPGMQDSESFFRKGIAGDWKNTFTDSNESTFDEVAGDLLKKLGYE